MKKERLEKEKPEAVAAVASDPTRRRVLQAAFDAFQERGYTGTSTLEIATRAKVSKRELYVLFADKQDILLECIIARAQAMRKPLNIPLPDDARALADALRSFGISHIRGVTHSEVLAVFRFAILVSDDSPEIARILEKSRQWSRDAIARMLSHSQNKGFLGAGDPAEIASGFFSVLWGDLLIRLLMRVAKSPANPEIERRADKAARWVLSQYPVARRRR
jgi:AcrR family transcriptional regulator